MEKMMYKVTYGTQEETEIQYAMFTQKEAADSFAIMIGKQNNVVFVSVNVWAWKTIVEE